jgi:hypothetical protein
MVAPLNTEWFSSWQRNSTRQLEQQAKNPGKSFLVWVFNLLIHEINEFYYPTNSNIGLYHLI